jgi:lysozyme
MDAGTSPGFANVRGLDVSHYQGTIDWDLVAQAGIAFAFIKATQGTTNFDPQFQTNWNGAHAAGVLRGAYHFYQPGDDPHQQAVSFLSAVQPEPGELPPVLDVELPGESSEIISGIEVWLATVEQAIGKIPILYTSPGFWSELGVSSFGRFPLWVAEYGVTSPKIPEGWSTWAFWQDSENGSVPGIDTPVDLDLFQGTLQELQQEFPPAGA